MKLFMLTAFLILALFSLGFNSVDASGYPSADPWYEVELFYDASSVPEGLSVIELEGAKQLVNNKSEPIYFVGLRNSKHFKNKAGVPIEYAPFYKIQDSKFYIWSTGDTRSKGPLWVSDKRYSGLHEKLLIRQYKIAPKAETTGNRQFYAKAPESHDFSFPIYHEEGLKYVTGKVTYSLYEPYDPNRENVDSYSPYLYQPTFEELLIGLLKPTVVAIATLVIAIPVIIIIKVVKKVKKRKETNI